MYDDEFFEPLLEGITRSAEAAVPVILDTVPARTVIDVGCGYGGWSAAFRQAGCRVVAVDGDHIPADRLVIPDRLFRAVDLTVPGALLRAVPEPADLVVCLEVAEHLPGHRARSFVAELVTMADTVVFSAAVPGQPADGHITCRWPSWWAAQFAVHGYRASTVLRERLWDDTRIDVWYRQNMMMFTCRPTDQSKPEPKMLDVIHPDMWAWFAPIQPET